MNKSEDISDKSNSLFCSNQSTPPQPEWLVNLVRESKRSNMGKSNSNLVYK